MVLILLNLHARLPKNKAIPHQLKVISTILVSHSYTPSIVILDLQETRKNQPSLLGSKTDAQLRTIYEEKSQSYLLLRAITRSDLPTTKNLPSIFVPAPPLHQRRSSSMYHENFVFCISEHSGQTSVTIFESASIKCNSFFIRICNYKGSLSRVYIGSTVVKLSYRTSLLRSIEIIKMNSVQF